MLSVGTRTTKFGTKQTELVNQQLTQTEAGTGKQANGAFFALG